MKNPRLALPALSLLALSVLATAAGCTTAPAAIDNRSAYDTLLGSVAQAGGASLLVSGCTYRDELGDDAILLDTSATVASVVTQDVTRYLTDQGAPPQPLATPVVVPLCAGFTMPATETVVLKTNADDANPRPMQASLLYPIGQPADAPGVREAVERLFQVAFGDAATADPATARVAPAPTPLALPLMPAERDTLRVATGRNWVWVVMSVDQEKSFGKGMLENQFGGGLLGAAVNSQLQAVPTVTRAALVDLTTGTRAWWGAAEGVAPDVAMSTSQMLSGTTGRGGTAGDWGDKLFAPILHTGVAPRVVGTSPVPVPAIVPPAPTPPPPATTVTTVTTSTNLTGAVPAAAATTATTTTVVTAPASAPTPVLATIVTKGRLAVHTAPRTDAPFTTLEMGTPLQILSLPTTVPDSPIHWVKVGAGSVQGWSTVSEVRAQY